MMTAAAYLARTQVEFELPVHPGDAPVHIANATGLQIAETIRLFNQHVDEHCLYERVRTELKQQILKAIEHRYLQVLEDADFGFADIAPLTMLNHMKATYGQVAQDDVEQNRTLLSADWNPDDPIEDVWIRIRDCQAFAAPIEPISDNAAIRLTLTVFEKTGVFATAVDKWRDKPVADHTLPIFVAHFNFENKERLRKLTAQTASFHGAHQAEIVPPSPPATALSVTPAAPPAPVVTVGEVKMYYCHSHGLGRNPGHTSLNCTNPDPDHKTAATIKNMMGGNDRISINRRRRPRMNS